LAISQPHALLISVNTTGLKTTDKNHPYSGQIIFTINSGQLLTFPVQLQIVDATPEMVFSPNPIVAQIGPGNTCQSTQPNVLFATSFVVMLGRISSFMNNPMVLSLFSLIFILLGCYNVFSGSKRIREAHNRGTTLLWYKQINILTGIEYILLALVFIVSTMFRSNIIPAALTSVVVPVYFVLLIAAAVLAGLVIRQGIINARAIRAQSGSSSTAQSNGTRSTSTVNQANVQYAIEDTAASQKRRRERRRNAAAARRRRAGKA